MVAVVERRPAEESFEDVVVPESWRLLVSLAFVWVAWVFVEVVDVVDVVDVVVEGAVAAFAPPPLLLRSGFVSETVVVSGLVEVVDVVVVAAAADDEASRDLSFDDDRSGFARDKAGRTAV